MHKSFFVGAIAALSVAAPAAAVTVVQAGDPGANSSSPRPVTTATAAAFDASTGTPTIVTFETAQPFFTTSGGSVTNSPLGGGSAVFGYNTTAGGQYVLESVGTNVTFTFANAISSFGAILTGVQLSGLTFNFNDGTAQSIAITNNGSGAQFFGLRDFANPITSITLNNPGDIIGIDDVRFTSANVQGGVPEPATWAMMMLGFGGLGYAMRRKSKVGTRVRFA